jgi:hypothetical protein
MDMNELIKVLKARAWTWKEISELHSAVVDIYWKEYDKAFGFDRKVDRWDWDAYEGNYGKGSLYGYAPITPTNESKSEFKNIAKEAKENSSKDEEALKKLKKELGYKGLQK